MLAFLLSCSPSAIELGPGDDASDGVERPEGTDTESDTDEEEEDDPHPERLFSLDRIHAVDLEIASDDLRSLRTDPYTHVPADLSFDDAAFPSIGVRIKGRLGSYRELTGKPAFKLDLDRFQGEARLEGLKAVSLNNMVQDYAQVHERAAYGVFRAMGIPAPRVGYAWVRINGDDYGLYSLVEEYDDEFLEANFQDPSGNLYDGDYYLPDNGNYVLLDFVASSQDLIQLDEGTDVGLADVHALTDAIAASAGTSSFQSTVGALADLDQHARFLAVTAWIGHYDSYSYYSNNYRVYFDPADGGRALMMPWDPDWAFYSGTAITSPLGVLSAACFADAECHADAQAVRDEIDDVLAREGVWEDIEATMTLIRPAIEEDTRREVSLGYLDYYQDDLESWFQRRTGEMGAF